MSTLTRIQRFTAVALITSVLLSSPWAAAVAQQSALPTAEPRPFATPEEASRALIGALRSGSLKMLTDVLGSDARPLVSTADFMADRAKMTAVVKEFETAHRLEYEGDAKAILHVGTDDRPLPIPIVRSRGKWTFDTRAGKEAILGQRIRDSERSAVQLCVAYGNAQREYRREPHDSSGALQYAQKIRSNPGLQDGLYWDAAPNVPASPLDPLAARAGVDGYKRRGAGAGPSPFHGYYFRILTSQGPDAPGGALDYVVHGRMTDGFALVAFPAEYRVTGIHTFIVSHDGVVYQKDLGPKTTTLGREMKAYNPDSTWTRVDATAR